MIFKVISNRNFIYYEKKNCILLCSSVSTYHMVKSWSLLESDAWFQYACGAFWLDNSFRRGTKTFSLICKIKIDTSVFLLRTEKWVCIMLLEARTTPIIFRAWLIFCAEWCRWFKLRSLKDQDVLKQFLNLIWKVN